MDGGPARAPRTRTADVVLVSDRGPVTFRSTPSGPVLERRPGSVTALLDRSARALREEVCWLAPSTSDEDRRAVRDGRFDAAGPGLGYGFHPVPCRASDYRRYYEDAGVRGLWYALHDLGKDLPSEGLGAGPPFRDGAALRSYQKVNRAVAAAAAARCHPRTVVCFQDYQFVTAPGFLRARLPTQTVGFFMHAAFAAPAALSALPVVVRGLLLRGMLAADVLGFQCERWADSFLDFSEEAGYEVDRRAGAVRHACRRTLVRRYPAPPDQEYLSGVFGTPEADRWSGDFRRLREGVRLLVRVDRLDPAKNVLRGFEAFALLLAERPELRDRVRFVCCLTPSRPGVPEYAWYAARVREAVAGIQRDFPGVLTVHWEEDRVRAMAALREYDVLLVNSVHDGMNLVAQEGVLVNRRDGAVVLSARTGSAERLREGAVVVHDPRDVRETAAVLRQALTMPLPERAARARRMRAPLLETSPEGWLRAQLGDLAAVRDGTAP
ncbi:trehalose-6-phosphate synthase [Streptomyces sp. NPDC093510]|uniref:trehalose-6-phosphate synthase n=1 Tax=Streptomyces sp. NPDC093510 TaxID=3155199 RepID=UPI00344155F4